MILTTDGALVHRLSHPRHKTPRRYLAVVEDLPEDAPARFAAGLILADGTECKPAALTRLSPTEARIVLAEGKYHQVRRMVAACGGHVVALHREAIGSLEVPADLAPGECRPLAAEELEAMLTEPLAPAPLIG